jgi:hypothetical protein
VAGQHARARRLRLGKRGLHAFARRCEPCMHLHGPRVDLIGKPCAREGRVASGSRDRAREPGAALDAGQQPACTCTQRRSRTAGLHRRRCGRSQEGSAVHGREVVSPRGADGLAVVHGAEVTTDAPRNGAHYYQQGTARPTGNCPTPPTTASAQRKRAGRARQQRMEPTPRTRRGGARGGST